MAADTIRVIRHNQGWTMAREELHLRIDEGPRIVAQLERALKAWLQRDESPPEGRKTRFRSSSTKGACNALTDVGVPA
jgi:hypothetical protein